MELILELTKNVNDRQIDIYKIGRYTVKKITYQDGSFYITISKERVDYLPEIYCRDDLEMNVLGFEIQTTSYGALSVEETKKMIAGLNEAIAVAEILTKEFVNTKEKMKKKFYFPLTVGGYERRYNCFSDWDEENQDEEVTEYDGVYALSCYDAIVGKFAKYGGFDDMSEHFYDKETVKEKISHMQWGFEDVNGCLYGTVIVTHTKPLSKEDIETIKQYITGQNSDGLGEGFEQQEIKTDKGFIFVSFWRPNNYWVLDEKEFGERNLLNESV